MVGRERPRRLLDDAFAEVRDQRVRHLVTILGAARCEQSRLMNEFITSQRRTTVQGPVPVVREGITYWLMRKIVRAATGIGQASPPDPDCGSEPS